MIQAERRKINALLRSALLHDDLEDDAFDVPDFEHLPDVDHRHKRKKGRGYDTARSSEWARSERTQAKRGAHIPEGAEELPSVDLISPLDHREILRMLSNDAELPLAQKQIAQVREGIESVFIGRSVLSAKDEEEAESIRKKAYRLYKRAGKAVTRGRQQPYQTVHMPKTGRANRATRDGRLVQAERQPWKDAQEKLRRMGWR